MIPCKVANRSDQRSIRVRELWPLLLVSGCARAPVFDVLGSYFPGWIACIVLGIVVAVVLRAMLSRLEWESRIAALPLFYVCLVLAFACAFWLIAFE